VTVVSSPLVLDGHDLKLVTIKVNGEELKGLYKSSRNFCTQCEAEGHLKNAVIAVGSISICMNITGWEAMLFIGINAAISVCVSNELGSGHARAAKYSVIVVIAKSLLIGIFFMALILITKDDFAVIFTCSKELQKAVSHLAPLFGFTMCPVVKAYALHLISWRVPLICIFSTISIENSVSRGRRCCWRLCVKWGVQAAQASERVRMWGGLDEDLSPTLSFTLDMHGLKI
ncbi:Detoxification-like protein, partial [Thalictrum thalictroides]